MYGVEPWEPVTSLALKDTGDETKSVLLIFDYYNYHSNLKYSEIKNMATVRRV